MTLADPPPSMEFSIINSFLNPSLIGLLYRDKLISNAMLKIILFSFIYLVNYIRILSNVIGNVLHSLICKTPTIQI